MRLAVISDIHDNLKNLKRCLDVCEGEKVEQIVCCGDVTTIETLNFLRKNFQGKIHLVRGNVDIFENVDVAGIEDFFYYGRIGNFKIEDKKIGLCHEPFLFDKVLENGNCDVVFYGHTHKPWIEAKNGVSFINPGTIGGVFQKSTFSIWDTETGRLDLKVLDSLEF